MNFYTSTLIWLSCRNIPDKLCAVFLSSALVMCVLRRCWRPAFCMLARSWTKLQANSVRGVEELAITFPPTHPYIFEQDCGGRCQELYIRLITFKVNDLENKLLGVETCSSWALPGVEQGSKLLVSRCHPTWAKKDEQWVVSIFHCTWSRGCCWTCF